jgi:hypothetical protein
MDQTGTKAQNYLHLLAERADEVLARGVPTGYPMPLAVSLTLAFDRLAADVPAGLQLLTLAAQLAPEPIPRTLFTAHTDLLPDPLAGVAADPLAMTDLVGLLRRRALVRLDADGFQLIHRLVATLLATRPADPGIPSPRQIAARLLKAVAPDDVLNNPAARSTWRQLLPHALALTDPARPLAAIEDDIWWLLQHAATYAVTRGDFEAAHPLFERAYQLARQGHGEDDPATLASARMLAADLDILGEHAAARDLAQDTLDRCRRVLGDDHPDTLAAAGGLVGYLSMLGEHAAARNLAQDTLDRCRQVLGDDHPDTLAAAGGLAGYLNMLGEHAAARDLAQDTLDRCRRVLGDDHGNTRAAAGNLAVSLRALGEKDAARELKRWSRTRRS